ncbi:MAG: GDP-L-fucose synthase [Desulfobacteraceae bacterium]|jgi:GDP-L-fucose synthase|nr:GDP-L-fucose synthase [Desulfobacteraceae bacterium]
MEKTSKIYIAGHDGLVGSALVRKFTQNGYENLITRHYTKLDLRRQQDVEIFFEKQRPEYVVLAAAKVGGILANNTFPAEFIYDNLSIQSNIIHAAWKANVKRLIFLGSSCIYPRECPQPMKEDHLLTGPLESTNEPYAIAKIAGIKMCQSYNRQYGTQYFALMPTNLYGPNDNYNLETSHVLPALIRKFHEAAATSAESVTVWGTGSPRREFLHVDDLADACLHIIDLEDQVYRTLISDKVAPLINVGCGKDNSIKEMALMIQEITGFNGEIIFDTTKPDGTPQKLLDVSLLNKLGWEQTIPLEQGISKTYQWCLDNHIFV